MDSVEFNKNLEEEKRIKNVIRQLQQTIDYCKDLAKQDSATSREAELEKARQAAELLAREDEKEEKMARELGVEVHRPR